MHVFEPVVPWQERPNEKSHSPNKSLQLAPFVFLGS